MPDEFSRDLKFIPTRSSKKYEVLRTQRGVIFKKLPTPSVLPEYHRPIPHPMNAVKKVKTEPTKQPINIVEQPAQPNPLSMVSPISNSVSFEDFQKKVEEMREKEKQKEVAVVTEEVPAIIEDAYELAKGIVSEEQELISKEYLKSLTFDSLKNVYKVATGKNHVKGISKFEMRKEILDKYKEASASRKKVIYESSKV